ncbi:MAG: glycosyltransferase family 39 protein [Steroidobacteraceae bacterium]
MSRGQAADAVPQEAARLDDTRLPIEIALPRMDVRVLAVGSLVLYAALHVGLLLYDLLTPDAWMRADRAAERMKHMTELLALPSASSRLAYVFQHNIPGDYAVQALLYGIGGRMLLLSVQVALCVLAVVCVYRIAEKVLDGPRRALLAAGVYALLPQTLVYPHQLSAEAWFSPLIVFAFYYAARWFCADRSTAAPRSGFSWALATLTRPTPLPFALLAPLAIRSRFSRGGAVAYYAALLAPMVAWLVIVHGYSGTWTFGEGTGPNLGANLADRVNRIIATLPPASRAAARERYLEPASPPASSPAGSPVWGVTLGEYLRFCGGHAGACIAYSGREAFQFFLKSGIEKITIDYLPLVSAQGRHAITSAGGGWAQQVGKQGVVRAAREYLASYPLVLSISIAAMLAFTALMAFYVRGLLDAVLAMWRGPGKKAASRTALLALLGIFPLYLFVASSVGGGMESRHRAAAEFAIAIVAVRGWQLWRSRRAHAGLTPTYE